MSAQLDIALRDAIRRGLRRLYGERLLRVMLYGSYARGEANEESDVDVLAVVRDPESLFIESGRTAELGVELALRFKHDVNIAVVAPDDFEQSDWPFFHTVREDGVPL